MTYAILKQHIRNAFDNPYTPYFLPMNILLVFLVGFSLPLIMTQIIPPLFQYEILFVWTHWPMTVCFTVEYLLRLLVAEKRMRYFTSPMGFLDLVTVIPAYLGLGSFGFLKTARFLRFVYFTRFADLANVTKVMPPKK
jgi:voltage-gated potassium channel